MTIQVYQIYQKIMATASFKESSNFSLIFPSFLFAFPTYRIFVLVPFQ